MNLTDLEQHVREQRWPEPSAQLRARVLAEAHVSGPPITWSDRLWFSRAFRMSAVASALALVALDQFAGSRGTSRPQPPAITEAQAQVIEEIGREVGLPVGVAASLARRGLAEPQPAAFERDAWRLAGMIDRGDRR